MKLHINAFKIFLSTDHGPYGTFVSFSNGLNVIRAENTSGKSALINGILYALGLEMLIGKRGVVATKPVLHTGGEYGTEHFKVIESYVELEITNIEHKTITIRRWIKGERDERLVEVIHGPILTNQDGHHYPKDAFYLGVEGAAQRERGFHFFLAEFLKLDIPLVKGARGNDVPLYVECIAPLMFVEQLRGWSGIQATLRQGFGIQGVAKLAVEYVLNMDAIENAKKRTDILNEASLLREKWCGLKEALAALASQAGGCAISIPSNPTTTLADEPWIAILSDGKTVSLSDAIVSKRLHLLQMNPEPQPTELPADKELDKQLETRESQLLIAQSSLAELRSEIMSTEKENCKLSIRLNFIIDDIKRNHDIIRLRDYGMESNLVLSDQRCPLCNHEIEDSLIPDNSSVMSIEDNINFLKTEKEAVELLINGGEERLQRLRRRMLLESNQVADIRMAIRDMRTDLLQNQSMSITTIREQIHLQDDIIRLEKMQDEFDVRIEELKIVTAEWASNRSKYEGLPEDCLSTQDKEKLNFLSRTFDTFVGAFGYRSTNRSEIHISEDNYRPVCDDFEISYGASASDNIRIVWAYTLGLLKTSLDYNGNHWGLVVFDEPEQQKMKETSSSALYSTISKIMPQDFQVIIATSAPAEISAERLKDLPYNLLEFGDKVIRPL